MELKEIIKLESKLISNWASKFEESKQIEELIEEIDLAIKEERNVYFIGIGKNVPMLQKVVATYRSLSIKAVIIDAVDILHGDFGIFSNSNELVIYVSKSGLSKELNATMKYMKENLHNVWMVTLNQDKTKIADFLYWKENIISLPECRELDNWDKVPTVSPIAFQIFFDSIGIFCAKNNDFKRNNFKTNHPGGKIGDTLKNDEENSDII